MSDVLKVYISICHDSMRHRPHHPPHTRAAQQDFPVKVREQKDGRLIANFQGTSRLIFGQEEAMGLRLQLDGKTVVLPSIFDPRWVAHMSMYRVA